MIEVHERNLVGLTRPAHRGAVLRHRLYAADHPGELVVLLRVEVVQKNLCDARAVADVRNRSPVGAPHGVEVFATLRGNRLHGQRFEVEDVHAPFAEAQQVEIGHATTVADERHLATIGRPLRHQPGVPALGELPQVPAVRVNHVDVRESALAATEHELLAVWAPTRADHGVEVGVEPHHDILRLDVENVDYIFAASIRRVGEQFAVGRKGTLRIGVAQLLSFRIERAVGQSLDALAVGGIGQVQVEKHLGAHQTAGGDVRNLPTIARERRRDIHGNDATRFLLVEQGKGILARTLEVRNAGQILRLHGVLPLVAQLVELKAGVPLESAVECGGAGRQ